MPRENSVPTRYLLTASNIYHCIHLSITPSGLRGCKNRPAPFPGRMLYKATNQALSVLSLSLGFFWCMYVVLLTRDSFYVVLFFYVICVFCCLVVLVRLSVPVQVIDWKDSSLT